MNRWGRAIKGRPVHDPEAYRLKGMMAHSDAAEEISALRAKPAVLERDWSECDPLFASFLTAQWNADLDGMSAAMDAMGIRPHQRTVL